MTNEKVAQLLRNVAAAYLLKDENRFRIIAYEKAADVVEESTREIKDLWKEGKLESLPGIGLSLATHLDELFKTGKVKHFEEVMREIPAGVFTLLAVPGFGAKKAYKLIQLLHLIHSKDIIKDLSEAARKGRIALIEGFGEKSQQVIIESLKQYKRGQIKENRMPLPYAQTIADEVISYLQKNPFVKEAVTLGSLRRNVATIGDIDVAVATDKPESVIDYFVRFPKCSKIVEKGLSGATLLLESGRQIDLRVQVPEKFGAMLQYFTGSKLHNIKLRELALKKSFSLNEYGIKPLKKVQIPNSKFQDYNKKENLYAFASEEKFYQALGLPWIAPELREDRGEIEAALQQAQGIPDFLPKLIELRDIKGDFHIHTSYDIESSHDLGSSSLEEILTNALKLEYEYIGISDHNPSQAGHTNDQIISILKRRKIKYEQIISSTKYTRVHLFIMLEVDILPDGKLALPDDAFEYIDAAIVSIHSSFAMNRVEMTKRILRALSHPKVKILGHPTGRLLGSRESIDVNWEEIFDFCHRADKALEINSFPQRLDLPDSLVKDAIDAEVKLVIDTDSHDASQMQLMRYGVAVGRRGWAEKSDIINTLSYNEVRKWLNL